MVDVPGRRAGGIMALISIRPRRLLLRLDM